MYHKLYFFLSDMEYDHLDYSRPVAPPIPHYHRATSSTMSTLSQKERISDQFPTLERNYDAPVTQPKQLNITVPPLPAKNQSSPSPSTSSSASTITQDENIDTFHVDKPTNKNLEGNNSDEKLEI